MFCMGPITCWLCDPSVVNKWGMPGTQSRQWKISPWMVDFPMNIFIYNGFSIAWIPWIIPWTCQSMPWKFAMKSNWNTMKLPLNCHWNTSKSPLNQPGFPWLPMDFPNVTSPGICASAVAALRRWGRRSNTIPIGAGRSAVCSVGLVHYKSSWIDGCWLNGVINPLTLW